MPAQEDLLQLGTCSCQQLRNVTRSKMHVSRGMACVLCRYVVRKNTTTNAVYLSRHYYSSVHTRRHFSCAEINWLDAAMQQHPPVRLQCKTRHGPKLYCCSVHWAQQAEAAAVVLDEDDQGLASGQYAVFYLNGTCIASAVICDSPIAAKLTDRQEAALALQGSMAAHLTMDGTEE